jgi:DNA mismatch repair protein MutS
MAIPAKPRTDPTTTPMMQQYLGVKAEHPDTLLFFRMGDFYELFFDDAKVASRVLGIALTSRDKGPDAVPMAGVPVRTVHTYLLRLVRAGHRVAICEQVAGPSEGRDLFRREVTRIVTAGTITEDEILDRATPNYLAAAILDGARAGIAWVDLSTGRFLVDDVEKDRLPETASRVEPAELLLPESAREDEPLREALSREGRTVLALRPDWEFERAGAVRSLRDQFGVRTLEGFGLDENAAGVCAAGALLRYLSETQRTSLPHLARIERFDRAATVSIDAATRSTLELVENRRGGREDTLLSVLDRTVTAMGGRLLRDWVLAPLRDPGEIALRSAGVRALVEGRDGREELREGLRAIADLERLGARIACERASPRDLGMLRASLRAVPALREPFASSPIPILARAAGECDPCEELYHLLERALLDELPLVTTEGGLIRSGFHEELDSLREARREGQSWIAALERKEVERSGIANLRVGFHRVFGYFLEVPRSQAERVPADYHRKQTLKSAERFITPELKDVETKILRGAERAKELEREIFEDLRRRAAAELPRMLATARALALLDVLASLAAVAAERGWVAPEVDDGEEIRIVEGRHPVLEARASGEPFVPNDALLDLGTNRLVLLTGPNMAGKSVYIRQVGLIALLAQIGSFVPAASARIGVVDRLFARIGAGDEIVRGQSTFMVEMVETANILHGATRRSLVLLDEIGRGTSTFDGMALAWAIAEHLLRTVGCRALFATHYHPLTDLAAEAEGARNAHLAVREWGEDVIFLHRVEPGATDRSYGLHVARLAGVPREVVERARAILADLERDEEALSARLLSGAPRRAKKAAETPDLFATRKEEVLEELRRLDPENLTPLEALRRLKELRDALP